MSMTIRVVIDILLGLGVFFSLVGVLGIIRMPDTYGRLQASTCIPSLGNIFMIAGGVVFAIATEPLLRYGILMTETLGAKAATPKKPRRARRKAK